MHSFKNSFVSVPQIVVYMLITKYLSLLMNRKCQALCERACFIYNFRILFETIKPIKKMLCSREVMLIKIKICQQATATTNPKYKCENNNAKKYFTVIKHFE